MKLYKYISILFLLILVSTSCSKDVKNSNNKTFDIKVFIENDFFMVRFQKLSSLDKKYFLGKNRMSSIEITNLLNILLKKEYKYKILGIDLYLKEIDIDTVKKQLKITKFDLKKIGIYFLDENQISFGMYSLPFGNQIMKTQKLSGIYCSAVLPFLFDKKNIELTPSVISITLNMEEIPNLNKIDLSNRKDDLLFVNMKKFI